ncbi:MAG: formate dehydrogenase accessory sulfurtransferase FdhD [Chitinophagales bacterium]|nr:formate dehydrogenase accessory sulfurtransferase FdhD [Chitinophagales bacterium]
MAILTYIGIKYAAGNFTGVDDVLTVEELLSIAINGKPYTITMRTPGSDDELVRGLLFTEGVYTDRNENPLIQIIAKDILGYTTAVNVLVDENKIMKDFAGKRNVISVSSCGICGKTELDDLSAAKSLDKEKKLSPEKVEGMFNQMSERQKTFQQSGGSHASAAFTTEGEMLAMEEDIGRHNAVDKVIGSLLMQSTLSKASCILVSGRVSYEIVSKAYCAGIPFLAAVSAPSSLAVDYSKELGITLMAFCRNGKLTVYSNNSQVILN